MIFNGLLTLPPHTLQSLRMLDESVATLEKHMSAHAADVAAARAELAAVAQRYALTPYATQRSGWYP